MRFREFTRVARREQRVHVPTSLSALVRQEMEALSKEGIASGKEEERLFPDDNFGAEGKEVEERLAGIVLHADAAMGVRGA